MVVGERGGGGGGDPCVLKWPDSFTVCSCVDVFVSADTCMCHVLMFIHWNQICGLLNMVYCHVESY